MTLTEFLLARIAEDEAEARIIEDNIYAQDYSERHGSRPNLTDDGPAVSLSHARVLAECEAKRRIIERHSVCDDVSFDDASTCPEMLDLGRIYADHPDYREEWAL